MRYLIALPLDATESASFIDLRDRYKHFAPRWKVTLGPHITLYRPSEFRLNQTMAIQVFKTAPDFEKLREKFEAFEAFLNYSNNVVYLEPKSHTKFKALREHYGAVAAKIMQDTSEIWPFHPHLTLVNRLDAEPAKTLLNELNGIGFNASYSFDRVCLYKKAPQDSNWVEIASNKLG